MGRAHGNSKHGISVSLYGQAKDNIFLDLAHHSYALGDEINAVGSIKLQNEQVGGTVADSSPF